MIDLNPLGDRAFLAQFGDAAEAVAWAESVLGMKEPGVLDVVVAFNAAAVYADPNRVDLDALEDCLRSLATIRGPQANTVVHEVPVVYDGEDLAEVAGLLGLGVPALIAAHSAAEYTVQAIGFLPGFPYAGELPGPLRGLPRRTPPRTRVPAGSVAIAGDQTAIYPAESPGGWNLLGRTPLRIVDVSAGSFPIRVGDVLAFRPIDAAEFRARAGDRLLESTRPGNV